MRIRTWHRTEEKRVNDAPKQPPDFTPEGVAILILRKIYLHSFNLIQHSQWPLRTLRGICRCREGQLPTKRPQRFPPRRPYRR